MTGMKIKQHSNLICLVGGKLQKQWELMQIDALEDTGFTENKESKKQASQK
jgi:hypothetical protein